MNRFDLLNQNTRRNTVAGLLSIVILIGGCATIAPEDDPVVSKMTQLEHRLNKVEKLLDTQGLLSLQSQVTDIQNEVSLLRGGIEQLEFDLNGSSERLRQAYQDIDQRLATVEGGQGVATSQSAFGSTSNNNTGGANSSGGAIQSDRDAYQAAFELLKATRYEEAATAFDQFLRSYPDSSFADNAQYWLGESRYVSRQYKDALGAFNDVLKRFPQSRKVPDALFKVGLCHFELGDKTQAKDVLEQVSRDYPGTSAARLAEQRITELF
ncbi:MAG: tol-pal system protein YbgF [Gammaproteobacteria bacterium]|nr:tol-pal system protein YbgF [Gammaproteobacteria bacterium]